MAGSALALAQPGGLGDERAAAPAQETTSTTADLTTTTDTATATSASPATTDTTAVSTPPGGDDTTTTVAGSGLAVAGPASGGSDGIAETGGQSMIGAGLGLLGLGLILRRAVRSRPA